MNHCDWLMPLFAVRKLEKINLNLKNNRDAFSQRDICISCENILDQSAVSQVNIIEVQINRTIKVYQARKSLHNSISMLKEVVYWSQLIYRFAYLFSDCAKTKSVF